MAINVDQVYKTVLLIINKEQRGYLPPVEFNLFANQAQNEIFEGYLSEPTTKTKGLILIIHDWDGLTEYEETRANMLSKIGYTAFAIDLYGKNNRPKETKLKKEETAKLYNNRERMRSLILAGLKKLIKKEI